MELKFQEHCSLLLYFQKLGHLEKFCKTNPENYGTATANAATVDDEDKAALSMFFKLVSEDTCTNQIKVDYPHNLTKKQLNAVQTSRMAYKISRMKVHPFHRIFLFWKKPTILEISALH